MLRYLYVVSFILAVPLQADYSCTNSDIRKRGITHSSLTHCVYIPEPRVGFNFKIVDNNLGNEYSTLALEAIESAGKRIANELNFKRPINVMVEFVDNFEGDRRLGSAKQGPIFVARQLIENEVSQAYQVPQALIKQHNPSLIKSSEKADFSIKINSKQNWNFKPNLDSIPDDLYDLEMVVAHELTHGLGFSTSLQCTKNSKYPDFEYLFPGILHDKAKNEVGVLPISIYDSLVHSGPISVKNWCRELQKFRAVGIKPNVFNDDLDCNAEFMAIVLNLFSLATLQLKKSGLTNVDEPILKFKDGSNAGIKAMDGYFRPGKSLCHLADHFKQTPDFLMTSGKRRGVTLNSQMSKYDSRMVYGPNTLKVMESLGWHTKESPNGISFTDISRSFN